MRFSRPTGSPIPSRSTMAHTPAPWPTDFRTMCCRSSARTCASTRAADDVIEKPDKVEKAHLNARSYPVNDHHFSRRHFFYGTLLAGAVPSGGFGSTPSLSALGYKWPNEKLNIGAVGIGIRGPAILAGAAASENIVALCDVDGTRAAQGFAQYPNAKKYKDYRKMFETEGKRLDAVMIATPDHMHTP